MPLSTPEVVAAMVRTTATMTSAICSARPCSRPKMQREADVQQHDADAHRGGDAEDGAHQGDDADAVAEGARARACRAAGRGPHGSTAACPTGRRSSPSPCRAAHTSPSRRCRSGTSSRRPHPGSPRPSGPSPDGRVQVLHDRAGHRVEQHVDPDAGGEQHRDPGEELVLRPRVVGAEPHVALLGERDPEHEADHERHREHVVPAEVRAIQSTAVFIVVRAGGDEHGPDRESNNNDCSDDKDPPVNLGPRSFVSSAGTVSGSLSVMILKGPTPILGLCCVNAAHHDGVRGLLLVSQVGVPLQETSDFSAGSSRRQMP